MERQLTLSLPLSDSPELPLAIFAQAIGPQDRRAAPKGASEHRTAPDRSEARTGAERSARSRLRFGSSPYVVKFYSQGQ